MVSAVDPIVSVQASSAVTGTGAGNININTLSAFEQLLSLLSGSRVTAQDNGLASADLLALSPQALDALNRAADTAPPSLEDILFASDASSSALRAATANEILTTELLAA